MHNQQSKFDWKKVILPSREFHLVRHVLAHFPKDILMQSRVFRPHMASSCSFHSSQTSQCSPDWNSYQNKPIIHLGLVRNMLILLLFYDSAEWFARKINTPSPLVLSAHQPMPPLTDSILRVCAPSRSCSSRQFEAMLVWLWTDAAI